LTTNIKTYPLKKHIKVNTIYGTGKIVIIQRWDRIARKQNESFYYTTYGCILDNSDKFKYKTNKIGYLHRDEINLISN
jgi:tRNA A37 threonylcarbamoyladenosine dehydratase